MERRPQVEREGRGQCAVERIAADIAPLCNCDDIGMLAPHARGTLVDGISTDRVTMALRGAAAELPSHTGD